MRPRVFPAEDIAQKGAHGIYKSVDASMRPRVFPAEDVNGGSPSTDQR